MTPRTEFGRLLGALWVRDDEPLVSELGLYLTGFTPVHEFVHRDLIPAFTTLRQRAEAAEAENARLSALVGQYMLRVGELERGRGKHSPTVSGRVSLTFVSHCVTCRDEVWPCAAIRVLAALPPPCAEHVGYVTVLRCTTCQYETTPMAVRG